MLSHVSFKFHLRATINDSPPFLFIPFVSPKFKVVHQAPLSCFERINFIPQCLTPYPPPRPCSQALDDL